MWENDYVLTKMGDPGEKDQIRVERKLISWRLSLKYLVGQAGRGDSSRQLVRNLGKELRSGNTVWEVISI